MGWVLARPCPEDPHWGGCSPPVLSPAPWAGTSASTLPRCLQKPSPAPPPAAFIKFQLGEPAVGRVQGISPVSHPAPVTARGRAFQRGGCCPPRCRLKAGGDGTGRLPQAGNGFTRSKAPGDGGMAPQTSPWTTLIPRSHLSDSWMQPAASQAAASLPRGQAAALVAAL